MKKAKKAKKAKPTLSDRVARAEKLLSESCDVTYRLGQLADRQTEWINGIRKTAEGLVSWRETEVCRLYARMDEVATTSEAAISNLYQAIRDLKVDLLARIYALERRIELPSEVAQQTTPDPQAPPVHVPSGEQIARAAAFWSAHTPLPQTQEQYPPGYYIVEGAYDRSLTIWEHYKSFGGALKWTAFGTDETWESTGDCKILGGPFSIADIHVPEKKEVPNE